MQNSVFLYTAGSLCVSSFTGTATEFNNVSAGLSKVWDMVAKELAGSSHELSNLMYCSADGTLVARLSNGSCYSLAGARFHGEISSYDAGFQLLENLRKESL